MKILHQYSVRLESEPSRVVIRPFHISTQPQEQAARARRIVDAVSVMSPDECGDMLEVVNADFASRHWQTRDVFLDRYRHVAEELKLEDGLTDQQRELIGAYFCHEYSYSAAAIMNPSVVPHIDQSGLKRGDQRFIM